MHKWKCRFFEGILISVLLVSMLTGCTTREQADVSDNSIETETETEPTEQFQTPTVNVDYLAGQTALSSTVKKANELANGVQAYYEDSERLKYSIENNQMKLTHALSDRIYVTSLENRNGGQYLFNTMDTYVVYNDQTFYEKKSPTSARVNTTRLGYYYYSTYLRDLSYETFVPANLEKAFYTYSDKMHQAFRILTTQDTAYMTEFGFEMKLKRENVNAIEVKADGETLTNPDGEYDFADFEYVGLDIKDAGIVGIIVAGQETKVSVEVDEYYVIIRQYLSLDGIKDGGEEQFGNRLYTDETHEFDGIRQANNEERNPLTEANITVDEEVDDAQFTGYNHLTGTYDFELRGTDFATAFYKEQQKKYYENIKIKDVPENRTLYFRVHTMFPIEGAAVVDSDEKLIPIPLQVCKNFGNEKEEPVYNPSDTAYGETYMPVCVEKDQEYDFSIINVYQQWGNYDIKQLSSIDYFTSYYHLSTGVTETNCISPYYAAYADGNYDFAWFLPDFRGCSGNFWGNWDTMAADPQYNSVGTVYAPTNNKGASMADYLYSDIKYSGLTHADLEYSFVAEDGTYEYTMRHVELPQKDESRTYYTIDFTFLEDCTLDNEQFSIIGFDGRKGIFSNAAYLDSDGNHQEVKNPTEAGTATIYPLNKEGSYFTYYGLSDSFTGETGNFGLIVKDYSITVDGKESEVGLAFLNDFRNNFHWGAGNYGALTLDATTSFKKGDTIHIDMILLPYGLVGQDDCQNVLNVYQDSVVNPLTVEAQVGEAVDDTYIPTVVCEDNTAEFTLTGGLAENGEGVNYAVKVQGFDKLTVPKIYEKVNEEWQEYKFSTELGYDGYGIDIEDDKLTYSFVFTQEEAGKTFKVTAE